MLWVEPLGQQLQPFLCLGRPPPLERGCGPWAEVSQPSGQAQTEVATLARSKGGVASDVVRWFRWGPAMQ